jgi:hypothetical protein
VPEELTRRRANRRPKRSAAGRPTARVSRAGKVRKAFWLDPRVLERARKSLGASSEREAVEMALDLAGFRRELLLGARTLRRLPLARID